MCPGSSLPTRNKMMSIRFERTQLKMALGFRDFRRFTTVTLHLTCANKAMRPRKAASSLLAGRASLGITQVLTHGSGWDNWSIFFKPCSGFVKALLPCYLPMHSITRETAKSLTLCWWFSLAHNVNIKSFRWITCAASLTTDLRTRFKSLPFAGHLSGCVRKDESRHWRLSLFILKVFSL